MSDATALPALRGFLLFSLALACLAVTGWVVGRMGGGLLLASVVLYAGGLGLGAGLYAALYGLPAGFGAGEVRRVLADALGW